MNKYLVINFDGYDSSKSTHLRCEAADAKEALRAHVKSEGEKNGWDDITDELEYLTDLYHEVSDEFACVSLEESDILIYKI